MNMPFVQCPPALPPTSPLWDHCPPIPRQESIICWCHCWVEGGGLWVTLPCPHPPSDPFANQNRASLFTLKVKKVVNISRPLRGGLRERTEEVPVTFEQTGHEAQEGSLDFPFQASPAATHSLIVCQQEFQGGLFLWSSVSWGTTCLRVKGSNGGACLTLFFTQMSHLHHQLLTDLAPGVAKNLWLGTSFKALQWDAQPPW